MQFVEQVERFYRNTAMMVEAARCEELGELKLLLDDIQKRKCEPLRVAIAGFMKAGKSTLMNAILREKLLFTGFLVTTYTVTWFKYGDETSLGIVLRDGSEISAPIEDLAKWTVISSAKDNPRIRDVKYVILYYPNEILKKMELIDTPGLFSPEDGDAKNTLDFLGLDAAADAEEINREQTSGADAIIYAFSHGLKEDDLKVVKAFSSTPINALGIFTKVDQSYWDMMEEPEKSPLEVVAPVVERLSDELKDNLYRILPVTAVHVEGSTTLDDMQWETLYELAEINEKSFMKLLCNAKKFAQTEVEGINISPERRKILLEKLGQYGIYLAVKHIQERVGLEKIPDELYAQSGVGEVCEVVYRHFGNRAYLIKTVAALARIEEIIDRFRFGDNDNLQIKIICNNIAEDIEKIKQTSYFRELDLLKDYYYGNLSFPTKKDEMSFLQLTGEYGNSCEKRLGMPEGATLSDMKLEARKLSERFAYMANGIEYPRTVNQAAEVILHSIQELYFHLDALVGF